MITERPPILISFHHQNSFTYMASLLTAPPLSRPDFSDFLPPEPFAAKERRHRKLTMRINIVWQRQNTGEFVPLRSSSGYALIVNFVLRVQWIPCLSRMPRKAPEPAAMSTKKQRSSLHHWNRTAAQILIASIPSSTSWGWRPCCQPHWNAPFVLKGKGSWSWQDEPRVLLILLFTRAKD